LEELIASIFKVEEKGKEVASKSIDLMLARLILRFRKEAVHFCETPEKN
jgi:hypothetical protein